MKKIMDGLAILGVVGAILAVGAMETGALSLIVGAKVGLLCSGGALICKLWA